MSDMQRFNNELSAGISEISDNSYCAASVFLGIANDGNNKEAH
jgi:hypothetical protein